MKTKALLALGGMVAVLSACSDSDDVAQTAVRVIHAVPDAPAVNITLNDAAVISNLDFAANSGTLSANVGTYDVGVEAILPGGDTATVISAADVPLSSGVRYTVVAVGTVDDTDAFPLEPVLIADDGRLADPSQVRVRVAHLASNAPTVDIYVTAPGADINQENALLPGVSFKGVSGALEVPAGNYQIRITPEGTKTVVYDSGTVALAAGADLLVGALTNTGTGASPVVLGVFGADSAAVVVDVSAGADLRAVHASPDVGNVDIYLDGVEAISDFAFGSVAPSATGYVDGLPAGDYRVEVKVAGTDTTGIDETVNLANGAAYTAIAVGSLSANTLDLVALPDQTREIATQATVRLVHGATLAADVDIYVVAEGAQISGEPAFSDVPFKASTGFFAAAAGSYDVVVTPAGTTTEALRATISLANGGIYSAIVRDNDTADGVTVILLDDFVGP